MREVLSMRSSPCTTTFCPDSANDLSCRSSSSLGQKYSPSTAHPCLNGFMICSFLGNFSGLQRILWMELRYARPRTRRHGESPVGDWRRRFHGRLRGIASTAVKSPSPPSGFTMPPDAKSGLRRTRKRRSADFTERARDVEFSRKRLSRTNGEGV